jgi:hypothetical protein
MKSDNRILAIHGAFSSPTIFNYLELQLCGGVEFDWKYVNYEKLVNNINVIIDQIRAAYTEGKPRHLVGHSMGGLICLALENEPWVESITTIATPLNGLEMNILQTMWSRSNFLQEISKGGEFIRNLQRKKYTKPIQHIISANGFSPWMYEPSDGVITLQSQKSWNIGESYEVEANHNEIMIHPRTAYLLKSWIEENSKNKG